MKQLFKKKMKMTRLEFQDLCLEIVASVEAWFAIIVIGSFLLSLPILLIGGIVELVLKLI